MEDIIKREQTAYSSQYGLRTAGARTRIAREQIESLQRNLVLSHAAGTGPLLADEVVRLVLVLKLASLAQGDFQAFDLPPHGPCARCWSTRSIRAYPRKAPSERPEILRHWRMSLRH